MANKVKRKKQKLTDVQKVKYNKIRRERRAAEREKQSKWYKETNKREATYRTSSMERAILKDVSTQLQKSFRDGYEKGKAEAKDFLCKQTSTLTAPQQRLNKLQKIEHDRLKKIESIQQKLAMIERQSKINMLRNKQTQTDNTI